MFTFVLNVLVGTFLLRAACGICQDSTAADKTGSVPELALAKAFVIMLLTWLIQAAVAGVLASVASEVGGGPEDRTAIWVRIVSVYGAAFVAFVCLLCMTLPTLGAAIRVAITTAVFFLLCLPATWIISPMMTGDLAIFRKPVSLVAVLVVACLASWFVRRVNRDLWEVKHRRLERLTPEQEAAIDEAVAEIAELGGETVIDEGRHDKPIIGVDLSDTQATDADLAILERLVELETLRLSGTAITDAGLKHLTGLTKLVYLDLSMTQVTDAGLERIKRLPLTFLDVSYTNCTDDVAHAYGAIKRDGRDQDQNSR